MISKIQVKIFLSENRRKCRCNVSCYYFFVTLLTVPDGPWEEIGLATGHVCRVHDLLMQTLLYVNQMIIMSVFCHQIMNFNVGTSVN